METRSAPTRLLRVRILFPVLIYAFSSIGRAPGCGSGGFRSESVPSPYDAGAIIELIDMQDEWCSLQPGDIGTVRYVDDAGQIQMRWRRGSRLALIPGVDSFRIIGHEEHI